ncbi:MAG: hypothetical protein WCG08_16490 [Paludibacter sp.]
MTNDRYFQFPLFLLRELMIDKNKALNDIIRYGLYSFAEKINPDLNEVIRQLMYCYYRNRADLPNDLIDLIESYIDTEKLLTDEDYNGFNGTEFNPEFETEQLTEIFQSDSEFEAMAIEFYKIRQAYSFMSITGNYQNCLSVGRQIQANIQKGEPMPMINKSQLFEYRDEDKTEFELMQFAVNIAIRSIIGEKTHSKTNKEMILCRAFGYKTKNHLPETMPHIFRKYLNRYHIDKVLQKIEIGNWNLIFYANNMRGMYIGFKSKISLEKLIEIAEMKREKKKLEDLKQAKKIAQEKVLKKIVLQRTQQN